MDTAELLQRAVGTGEREGRGRVVEGPLGQGETFGFASHYTRSPLRAWCDLIYNLKLSQWLLWGGERAQAGQWQRDHRPPRPTAQVPTKLGTVLGVCKPSGILLITAFVCNGEWIPSFLNLDRIKGN